MSTGTPLEPWQERIADAAAHLLDQMPPELVAECRALVALDPACAGLRLHHDPEADTYAFTWVGRWLGTVPGPWLREGIDDTEPGA
jgi:hypothetical protein